MAVPVRRYVTSRYPPRRATFIPRAPIAGGVGAGLGSNAGNLGGTIGGIAGPLLCLGLLSSLALLGLFATMIAAAVYMNKIQNQVRKNIQGAGTTIELNIMLLCCTLLCSIYILSKHMRGVTST